MRRENGVYERRLSKTSLANDNDVELETSLQQLVLNLLRDGVETDIRVGANLLDGRESYSCGGHFEDWWLGWGRKRATLEEG